MVGEVEVFEDLTVDSSLILGHPVYAHGSEKLELTIRDTGPPSFKLDTTFEPVKVKIGSGTSVLRAVQKDSLGVLSGGFIAYLGAQLGNPLFVYGGVAIAALYVLRNFL